MHSWLDVYSSLLNEVLLRHSEKNPYVRMICLPSFGREWAVTINMPQEDSAEVQYVIVKQPIWMNPSPKEIETDVAVARPSKAIARKVRLAWIAMLTDSRNMGSGGMVFDGVNYQFSAFVNGRGVLTEEVWQPSPQWLRLQIGEVLRDFARTEAKDRERYETLINQKVETLLGQIPVLEWHKRLVDDGG